MVILCQTKTVFKMLNGNSVSNPLLEILDLNHDGIIQGRELYQTMSGLTSEMESIIIKMINDTHIDPDKMSFPDFLIFMCQRRSKVSSAHCIQDLFQEYGENEEHLVTAEQVQDWLLNHGKKVTSAQAQAIVHQMDYHDEGAIIYDDFLTLITARLLTIRLRSI